MKLRLLVSLSILVISLDQSNAQHKIHSVQVSYNQVVFPFSNFDFHKNDFSYRFGGMANLYLSKHLGISTGIYFESQNFSANYPPRDSFNPVLMEEDYMFKYLSFPLLLEVVILHPKSHAFFIQGGFEIDRLLAYDYQKLYSDGTYHEPYEFSVSKVNTSILIGPGYRYFLNDYLSLGFSTKYRYNFTSPGRTGAETTRNSFVLQFNMGYCF